MKDIEHWKGEGFKEDVQRDNGMLPAMHDSYGCGQRPCVARKYVTCKACLYKLSNDRTMAPQ